MDEIKDVETIAKIKAYWAYCDEKMRLTSRSSRSYLFAQRARTIMNVFGTRNTPDRMFRNVSESDRDYQTALKLLEMKPQDAVLGRGRYLLQH